MRNLLSRLLTRRAVEGIMVRLSMVTGLALGQILIGSAAVAQPHMDPVGGVWESGQVVEICGPSYVPADTFLTIKPGVTILFKTDDPLHVFGEFRAEGTAEAPIILIPFPGWDGFIFHENGNDIRRLHFVIMEPSGAFADRVIVAERSLLEIADCDFRAVRSCFDLTEGRLWADRNTLLSVGLYSKTVRLQRLYDNLGPGCAPGSNRFKDNMVTAEVLAGAVPIDPTFLFTAGLLVDASYNTCLYGNAFAVSAPGEACGVYFGQRAPFGGTSQLQYCVIVAKSTNDSPKGVYQGYDGSLELIHCTIDVAREDPGNFHRTVGVLAAPHARVLVNSCIVRLDEGSRFFHTEMPSTINVDYTTRWTNGQFLIWRDPDVVPIYDPKDGRLDEWNDGGHNLVADPMFWENGEFLRWAALTDIESYYSLRPGSPCIDAADTVYGYDPDQSLPDIGRYNYRALSADDGFGPVATSFEVGQAYPNPFNAATVIPFSLRKGGFVGASLHDLLGRRVQVVASGFYPAGYHELHVGMSSLPSGLYWVNFDFGSEGAASRRLVLIK